MCAIVGAAFGSPVAKSDPSTRGIIANCFSPGLIVGTGLFRDQNPVFTKLFDIAATNVLKVGENPGKETTRRSMPI